MDWPYTETFGGEVYAEQDRADEDFERELARRDRLDDFAPAAVIDQTVAARRDIERGLLR